MVMKWMDGGELWGNATKLTSPDLKASGNEAAIETIELAHEGVEIENG